MKKNIRGKRYLRSRKSVIVGRERRRTKKDFSFEIRLENLSKRVEGIFKEVLPAMIKSFENALEVAKRNKAI